MPVLRSQRSKPSASSKKDEEDMPPPAKGRSTRSKKVSKQKEEVVSDEPESPAPSSSRSTRTRTRSKVMPVEEVGILSPPSTRSTRSTRAKPVRSKVVTESSSKGQGKKDRSAPSINPVVQMTPLKMESMQRKPVRAETKKKARPVKRKGPVESSDDLSEDEGEMKQAEEILTLEQLHRQHADPLKTALGMAVCDVYPKCMTKLRDNTASARQEKEFQRLMSIPCIMPPPAAPVTKTKGRKKRARSPEKVPVNPTKVPDSFNFADNNLGGHVPAKKKMIMDIPTPESEDAPEILDEEEGNESSQSGNVVAKEALKKKKGKAKVPPPGDSTAEIKMNQPTGKVANKVVSEKLDMKLQEGKYDDTTDESEVDGKGKKKAPTDKKQKKVKGIKIKGTLEDNDCQSTDGEKTKKKKATEDPVIRENKVSKNKKAKKDKGKIEENDNKSGDSTTTSGPEEPTPSAKENKTNQVDVAEPQPSKAKIAEPQSSKANIDEPQLTTAKGKVDEPQLSAAKEKVVEPQSSAAKEKVAEPQSSAAKGKVAEPQSSAAKGKGTEPQSSAAKEKVAEPQSSAAKGKGAEPQSSATKEKVAEFQSSAAKGKVEEPQSSAAKGNAAEPLSSAARGKVEEPQSSASKGNAAEPLSSAAKGKVAKCAKDDDYVDIFEQSTVDLAEDSVIMFEEEIVDKASKETRTMIKQDTESKDEPPMKKSTTVPTKTNVALNATYVADTPEQLVPKQNATFTPELFTDTPKSRIADQTVVISKHTGESSKGLTSLSPESEGNTTTTVSASGKVSTLVNFFNKSKKEADTKNGNAISSKTDKVELDVTRCISPHLTDYVDKSTPISNDLNSTYVLPTASKTNTAASAMNVTVCVKKSIPEPDLVPKPAALKPILPPATFLQPTNSSRFMHDSPASRTFCKEPLSLATLEEEVDGDDASTATKDATTADPIRPIVPNVKPVSKDKNKDKGMSSSSSSSSSSMKSASSQPCLATKKLPASAIKNTPTYGSSGKLNEVNKAMQDAEKRKQEILQQKIESTKKKNAEWSKKTEKNKEEKTQKVIKEKQKGPQPFVAVGSSSQTKKPPAMIFGKPDGPSAGPAKTKCNFGMLPKPPPFSGNLLPPLSKNPFHKNAHPIQPPPPPMDSEMEESFKSACNSFLDQTGDVQLSSYDITVYEDLDEDLKHRENKTVPHWASNKDALNTALYSMVLLPEYENKFRGGFPKADKSYKLFPSRSGHH